MSLLRSSVLIVLLSLLACDGSKPAGHEEPDAGSPPTTSTTCEEKNPCTRPGQTVCRDDSGEVVCECDPGRHLEDEQCVPDAICLESSCNGNGTCEQAGTGVFCTCNPGWTGTNCQGCDEQGGYHPDGTGGCTADVCRPTPCTGANTVCIEDEGAAKCTCAPGFHDEGGACVVDEVCSANSCSTRGGCSVEGGRISCDCDPGYVGAACASCDAVGGYHDDGQGGCTNDPCLPNPCAAANKGQCAASQATTSGYVCGCDPGFHDDGVGNCTQDPCLPNLCAAQNQACESDGSGGFNCYTPVCDDQNPCTVDTVSGGNCVHTPLSDDSPCSTGICTSGQTCLSGQCTGGSAVVCNDDNPCTVDSCDSMSGCAYVADDALVPDDGVPCTLDRCNGGLASHAPDHDVCDDGQWCTGTESCAPSNPAAVNGCVRQDVPSPPPLTPSPCASYGACDESSKTFPLITQPTGASCNDGLGCTTGDACTSDGVCAGTVTASCGPSLDCGATSTWPGNLDFSMAVLSGDFTLAGGALPASAANSDAADFFLIDRTTGTRVYLGGPDYAWNSTQAKYTLIPSTASYTAKVLPGVYDLLYQRGTYASAGQRYSYLTDANDTLANGEQLLARDLVVGLGVNRRNIDLPIATISGSFTLDGAALPDSAATSDGAEFFLVDTTTGVRSYIGGPDYAWNSSQAKYTLIAATASYQTRVLPGTYDLLYRRGTYTSGGRDYAYKTEAADTIANGFQYVRRNVVIAPGIQTLDLDFSRTLLSGSFSLNGGPLPASAASSDGVDVYLRDRTTGARTYIGGPDYAWNSAQAKYVLMSGTGSYQTRVLPGAYDLIYTRGVYTSSGRYYAYRTEPTDTLANGEQILVSNVVIAAGTQTLNVDFSLTSLTGAFSLNGGAVPASAANSDGVEVYLIDATTGTAMYLGGPDYAWSSAQAKYVLASGTASYAAKVLPGTYDVLYRRGTYTSGGVTYAYRTDANDTLANGDQVLTRNLALAPGGQTHDVDFSLTSLGGGFTFQGGALPPTAATSDGVELYLVDRTTGTRMYLGGPDYAWSSAQSKYVLASGTAAYEAKVLPGTYDLLYARGTYVSSGVRYAYKTESADTLANGEQLLQRNLAVSGASQAFPIDLSLASRSGAFTFAGGALPASAATSDAADFFLIDRTTGVRTYVGGPDYAWSSAQAKYVLVDATSSYAIKILPGTYDVLYRRGTYVSGGIPHTYRTEASDSIANGEQLLGTCVAVP